MKRILDAVEELHTTPERLETMIQGKYFLTAVRTLLSAIRTLNGADLMEIGALEGVKERLTEIRRNLHETLVEELHNHLYLKSAFTVDRLEYRKFPKSTASTSLRPSRERLPGTTADSRALTRNRDDGNRQETPTNFKQQSVSYSADDVATTEDFEKNPEEDSFQYMRNLLEGLHLLGRLPHAFEVTRDRLPVELYYVVERTIQEIDQRQPRGLSKSTSAEMAASGLPDLIDHYSHADQAAILDDLLSLLYQKYQCIIQGHTFILDVIADIHKNTEDFTPAYTIDDAWTIVQNEIKALLYDYLTVANRSATQTTTIMSMNEIMKQKVRSRDHTMPAVDIVTMTVDESLVGSTGIPSGIIDKYASVVATGHRLLVAPDAQNVLVAYKPTCEFIKDVEASIAARYVGAPSTAG
ncbi:hypothetical protein HDV00_001248 [Rhizophlyctis rosea]|nr:hypothetical protein HDV00_001248 [Rhizophlyctis rosea]